MKTRLLTCLLIGVGLLGILGAAYTRSPMPLVLMLLLGGVFAGVSMMALDAVDWRKLTGITGRELRSIFRAYSRRPRHSLKLRTRMRLRLKGLNVR